MDGSEVRSALGLNRRAAQPRRRGAVLSLSGLRVTAAEATYSADVTNVATIETAIATATAPLTAAQTQAATDATAFNASLDALSAAALAAKVATN